MAAKDKDTKEPKEDAAQILLMIGWQVAAGVLFVAFGLEFAFSNIVLHALRPFEHGRNALASLGFEGVGLNGLCSTIFILVGSLNLGVASYRFARVLRQIDEKK
jgi:hypothetical protein